ncbi:VapE domain-containing protein [Filimonas effusa]|uniref:Virulence-associated protein E-like domain-containing protein n=1 Tax=Filimonas effusa TaxID=2508721 RepID=A0A4Q1DC80_9BACT|nr:VapE domain-containing protein [Filimonas effusa]RXK86139.1 hypothetical protein ESB13_04835 [Filimonas effusa]
MFENKIEFNPFDPAFDSEFGKKHAKALTVKMVEVGQNEKKSVIVGKREEAPTTKTTYALKPPKAVQELNDQAIRVEKPKEIDSIAATKEYWQNKYDFRRNDINSCLEFRSLDEHTWRILDDHALNSLYFELHMARINVKREVVGAMLRSDFVSAYNPIHDYIQGLSEWDGHTDYISEFAERVKTTNQAVFNKFFKKWMLAVVASCWLPEATNHLVLLLKGRQGIGKTRWLRSLVPAELKQYCYEGTFNPAKKEQEQLLAERILIILDEFDIKTDRQMDAFKSAVSSEIVNVKKAYAGYSENKSRIASFAGTTNRTNFLNDSTGTRRFFVAEATEINSEPYEHLDMVYAQAFYLLRQDEKFYLSGADIAELNELNADHAAVDLEQEYLSKYVGNATDDNANKIALSATEITEHICEHSPLKFSRNLVQKIGVLLKQNGFRQRKSNGRPVYDVVLLKEE